MKDTSRLFKALADDTRLRIMALLLTERELCVCDIMAAVQLPQSTVSRHLAYLRNNGLVEDRRAGVWMYYSIPATRSELLELLVDFLKKALPGNAVTSDDRARLKASSINKNCG